MCPMAPRSCLPSGTVNNQFFFWHLSSGYSCRIYSYTYTHTHPTHAYLTHTHYTRTDSSTTTLRTEDRVLLEITGIIQDSVDDGHIIDPYSCRIYSYTYTHTHPTRIPHSHTLYLYAYRQSYNYTQNRRPRPSRDHRNHTRLRRWRAHHRPVQL
jgi:hypothetical protein